MPQTNTVPFSTENWISANEGQLSVDVMETNKDIIIHSTIAGVKPEDLDVHISQDVVTIRGTRKKRREQKDSTYHFRECYWGSFSRTVLLPSHINTEKAKATLRNGILTLTLPKITLETRLDVKG